MIHACTWRGWPAAILAWAARPTCMVQSTIDTASACPTTLPLWGPSWALIDQAPLLRFLYTATH